MATKHGTPIHDAPTIWEMIEAATIKIDTSSVQRVQKNPRSENEKKKDLKKLKRWVRAIDVLAVIAWAYSISKLFVYDFDVQLVSMLGSGFGWILWFKSAMFLTILILVAIFLWKWKTLAAILYIIFFPIIIIAWKIPRFLYKSKSWLAVIATINWLGILIKNFRYNLIAKGLGLISAMAILFANTVWLVAPAATTILLLLLWGSTRTVKLAFTKDWFLDFHQRTITKIVDSKFVKDFTSLSPEIKKVR